MLIREIMRTGAFTIGETDCLGHAHRAMVRSHIRHLPVMSDAKLVGILSERDILAARARLEDGDWSRIPVSLAMQPTVQTATPADELALVARRMAAGKLGAMPILEGDTLVGIVTVTDVLAAEARMTIPIAAQLTVTDVMTAYPITAAPGDDLAGAIERMTARGVRHLPIVANGEVIGMLSERDVRTAVGDPFAFVRDQRRATVHARVQDVMTPSAFAITCDVGLVDLARRFATEHIEAVPIVDRFGALVGIVSYVDIVRALVA